MTVAPDEVIRSDAIVVGSGVAGLTTTLRLAPLRVTLLTKTELGDGSSRWAKGGVAAAMGAEDAARLHAGDTVRVGAELANEEVVALLTEEGPAMVSQLVAWGARFDRTASGELALGREAGHSRRRIVHAHGDATGRELVRALIATVQRDESVTVREREFAARLVQQNGRVVGVLTFDAEGRRVLHLAAAVVLATGGIGQIYANTTNPQVVTGDGLALAARAGARLVDLEFVQFHPTALDTGADPMPLLTEALRGEGAAIVDDEGHRFMEEEHAAAELAPRDVVAQAIWTRLRAGRKVFLDTRQALGDSIAERFPSAFGDCMDHGIDPRRRPIPIAPAAHYHMGGVAVDLAGRTSLPGLWSCGEVASTGAHGANRLASNSLLEAMVWSERVAADVARSTLEAPGSVPSLDPATVGPANTWPEAHVLRELMWEQVGLVRDGAGLASVLLDLERFDAALPPGEGELNNMALVGRLVATAALRRTESRGSHFRRDFPGSREEWRRHQPLTIEDLG